MCGPSAIVIGKGPVPDGLLPVIVDCCDETCKKSTFYKAPTEKPKTDDE